jgi:hypothetical protein
MWVTGCLLLVLALAAAVISVLLHRIEPFLRARIVEALEDRFHARVELDSFHVSLMNGLWAEGKGLRIWPPARVEGVTVPGTAGQGSPLIGLDEFRFHAPLRYQPGKPLHINEVQLKGLHLFLPPRSHFEHATVSAPPAVTAGNSGPAGPPAAVAEAKPKSGVRLLTFQIDTIECTVAQLVLGTSKPDKLPLDFAIAHFKLTNVSSAGPMGFDAELTNPRPVGTIHSTGSFGPWLASDPGESPISGDYRFDRADLSVFKGIAGILSSTGHYQGTLRDLVADGDTDVPDFRLTHFGNALPLHAHFHAKVDATDGDTWLEPVEATLGHSHFSAQGQVVRVLAVEAGGPPQSKGHDIALSIDMDRARIEDFLRLASHSATPLLTGDLTMKAALHIPPGAAPVHERMTLEGSFALDQAHFTSAKIQDRIEELSLRGQGRPGELKTTDPASIHSAMLGHFQLAGGAIALPELQYTVPGAEIQLKGAYGLEGGTLDFAGTAKTDATVSQMVGGWKGFLLKPADRFFKKNGAGAQVPIHIEGTREDPKFGIGLGTKQGPAELPAKHR